jgi:hypothetical protein
MKARNAAHQMAMLVVLTFDSDLLEHFDVSQWNDFMGKLIRRGMTPVAWTKGRRPPPLGVMFDFRGLSCTCQRRELVDFTFCDLGDADFTATNLLGAKLGSCPGAVFTAASLESAHFRGDISGADFTDAEVGDADFSHAYYHSDNPPTGLPPEVLAACDGVPPSVDGDDGDAGADLISRLPADQTLSVKATIHEVPW